jgi:hypothetical protein
LALAAGQLRGRAAGLIRQSHHVQGVADPASPFAPGHAAHLESVFDVLRHRHVGEQGVLLEDGVDVASARRKRGDVDPAEVDPARGGLLEPGDHPQDGGLARAGRAEDREQFAVADGQVGAFDRRDLAAAPGVVGEDLADTDQLDLRIVNGGSGVRVLLRTDGPRGHWRILRIPR